MSGYPSRTPGDLGDLVDRIDKVEGVLRGLTTPTKEAYAQAVASLNVVRSSYGDTSGAGLSSGGGGWIDLIDLTLTVAKGKSRLEGQIVANGAFVDMTSGGLATAQMRFVVTYPDGSTLTSPTYPAAKDAGASAVNNVLSGSFFASRAGLNPGDKVIVSVQFYAANAAAFPSNAGNFASASAIYVSSAS